MEVNFKKSRDKNYLIISDTEIDENNYKNHMVMNNNIDGIISFGLKSMNNNIEICYDITSLITLKELYTRKRMSGMEIYELIKSIMRLSENIKEYLIDINNIMFGAETIFYNRQTKKYLFCYFPKNEEDITDRLRQFFDELLEYINHNDKLAVLIAYGIQQETIHEGYTVKDLLRCAEKIVQENSKNELNTGNANNKELSNQNSAYKESKEPTKHNQKDRSELGKNDKKKRGVIDSILNIFKPKTRYLDEDELNVYGNITEDSTYSDVVSEEGEEYITGQEEDVTMLLTDFGIVRKILLRGIDENPLNIQIKGFPCIIGKSLKSSDYIIDNPVISRVHARIVQETDGYFIEDLNSTNGTFVNDIRLKPHEIKEISPGDYIALADVKFCFEHIGGDGCASSIRADYLNE